MTTAYPMGPVMCIVGARPNFMKMAPILRALAAHEPPLPAMLVHNYYSISFAAASTIKSRFASFTPPTYN